MGKKKAYYYTSYEDNFKETNITTMARAVQMGPDLIEYCKEEINSLLHKRLIRKSYSPWSCTAFYVYKNAEIERGAPRLIIKYKPLNKVLKWIRYLLPNKKDLFAIIQSTNIFSKFDLKSGYWQIQIDEKDKYKTFWFILAC